MIATALTLFRVIPGRGWLTIAAIAAALAGALYFRQHFINQGAIDAAAKIERANDAAKDRFNDASDQVNRCYAAGGDWDRFERVCKRSGG
ncbi:hypothetical protein [Labrys sp. ZIDIC5]|uniref:hypothetical protein n=1 Tax=Labrys sedimenti TaxID=3106036 RepID=UPI002ACAB021|nr:hypothetical protein [Labrys sp. ZIDIC5]MDZ5453242.1 hypothetical protein [Labrys sp. ZIDIC5]